MILAPEAERRGSPASGCLRCLVQPRRYTRRGLLRPLHAALQPPGRGAATKPEIWQPGFPAPLPGRLQAIVSHPARCDPYWAGMCRLER